MNAHFFVVIVVVLLTRLQLMRSAKTKVSLSIAEALYLSLVPAIFVVLAYRLTPGSMLLVVFIFAIYQTQYLVERIAHRKFEGRVTSLATNLARSLSCMALVMLVAAWSADHANHMVRSVIGFFNPAVKALAGLTAPFAQLGWGKVGAIAMGLLLVTNEVNIVFRFVLDAFSISHPGDGKSGSMQGTEAEYNTGRLIGILERIIVYFLVIIGRYEAIGFIMAAKAFTRFKDLDNRAFAEYVLIGTLLSITLSVVTALFIKRLILVLP